MAAPPVALLGGHEGDLGHESAVHADCGGAHDSAALAQHQHAEVGCGEKREREGVEGGGGAACRM